MNNKYFFYIIILIFSCNTKNNNSQLNWNPCNNLDLNSDNSLCNFLNLYGENCNIKKDKNIILRSFFYTSGGRIK